MLYNDHRPAKFKDVMGQDAVAEILKAQLRKGTLGHAYIFGGPSGVGKTTMARILAAAANCQNLRAGEPCGKCSDCVTTIAGAHWDVVEMDAASNRGIDDVRDMIGRSYLSPMSTRKVYIVDEAHGLTQPAWDALLKTVEEPPPHLLWIFCTTRPDQLPETVLSRCQGLRLSAVETRQIAEVIEGIARSMRVTIDHNAAMFIAEQAGGNVRMALSTLEQVTASLGREVNLKKTRNAVQATLLV